MCQVSSAHRWYNRGLESNTLSSLQAMLCHNCVVLINYSMFSQSWGLRVSTYQCSQMFFPTDKESVTSLTNIGHVSHCMGSNTLHPSSVHVVPGEQLYGTGFYMTWSKPESEKGSKPFGWILTDCVCMATQQWSWWFIIRMKLQCTRAASLNNTSRVLIHF